MHRQAREVVDLSQAITDLGGQRQKKKFALLLRNVLTPKECHAIIKRADSKGYHTPSVHDANSRDRCIIDDAQLAERIYQNILSKLKDHPDLRRKVVNWKLRGKQYAVGCNERLRVLRYNPGCQFKPHFDGSYIRGNEAGSWREGETSEVTVLVYLNEGYEGGQTNFLDRRGTVGLGVEAQRGSVLLFEHMCNHEGAKLKQGHKYVLRTEVMYTDRGPGHEYSRKGLLEARRAGKWKGSDL